MAVLGVGGVFFKCADPEASKAWYADVLVFSFLFLSPAFSWQSFMSSLSSMV